MRIIVMGVITFSNFQVDSKVHSLVEFKYPGTLFVIDESLEMNDEDDWKAFKAELLPNWGFGSIDRRTPTHFLFGREPFECILY